MESLSRPANKSPGIYPVSSKCMAGNGNSILSNTLWIQYGGSSFYNFDSANKNSVTVQHCVHVDGCNITIDLQLKGFCRPIERMDMNYKEVPYDISLDLPKAMLLFGILGYNNVDIPVDTHTVDSANAHDLVHDVNRSQDTDDFGQILDTAHDMTNESYRKIDPVDDSVTETDKINQLDDAITGSDQIINEVDDVKSETDQVIDTVHDNIMVTETEGIIYPVHDMVTETERIIYPVHDMVTETERIIYPVHDIVTETERIIYPVHDMITETDKTINPIDDEVTESGQIISPVDDVKTEFNQIINPVDDIPEIELCESVSMSGNSTGKEDICAMNVKIPLTSLSVGEKDMEKCLTVEDSCASVGDIDRSKSDAQYYETDGDHSYCAGISDILDLNLHVDDLTLFPISVEDKVTQSLSQTEEIEEMSSSEIDHSCLPAGQLKSFEHDHSYCTETAKQLNQSVDVEGEAIKLEYDIVSVKCDINPDFNIDTYLERYTNDNGYELSLCKTENLNQYDNNTHSVDANFLEEETRTLDCTVMLHDLYADTHTPADGAYTTHDSVEPVKLHSNGVGTQSEQVYTMEQSTESQEQNNIEPARSSKDSRHGKQNTKKRECKNSRRCEMCGRGFTKLHNRKSHICTETFRCITCGNGFTEKKKLERHEKTHSVDRRFRCSQCDRGFTAKKWFIRHMINGHTFKCLSCAKDFLSARALRSHNSEKHSNCTDYSVGLSVNSISVKTIAEEILQSEKDDTIDTSRENQEQSKIQVQPTHNTENKAKDTHECHVCVFTTESIDNLKIHMKEHTKQEIEENMEDMEEHIEEHMEEHMKEHTEEHVEEHREEHSIEKPFQCTLCSCTFTRKCQLKQHMRKRECKKSFRCEVCGMGFTQLDSLKSHFYTHNNTKTFQCSMCGKGFTQKKMFEYHERMCDRNFTQYSSLSRIQKWRSDFRRVGCSVCGKKVSKAHMKQHMETHTQGYKAHKKLRQCDVCGKMFSDLVYHKMTHTGEKNIQCSVCDHKFRHNIGYKVHMRTHTGEQPYSCDVCNRKFSTKLRSKLHKLTHTGEKSFKCTECDKCFPMKPNLILHMRTHTGERPYVCPKCGVGFSSKSGLNSHAKVHTSDKPYKCLMCGASFLAACYLKRHWQKTH